jgi:hypothetical protein
MKKWSSLVVAITCVTVAALSTPATASAQVLFSNPPNGGDAYGTPEGERIANDFMLSSAASISSFTWWAMEATVNPTLTATFDWAISADDGNHPAASAIASGTATNLVGHDSPTYLCCAFNGNGFAVYEFTQAVSSLSLSAGTRYWLSISNFSGGDGTTFWAAAAFSGDDELMNPGAGWVSPVRPGFHADGALCLSGPVESCSEFPAAGSPVSAAPEPASLVLLATGFAGIAGIVRRRKNG